MRGLDDPLVLVLVIPSKPEEEEPPKRLPNRLLVFPLVVLLLPEELPSSLPALLLPSLVLIPALLLIPEFIVFVMVLLMVVIPALPFLPPGFLSLNLCLILFLAL